MHSTRYGTTQVKAKAGMQAHGFVVDDLLDVFELLARQRGLIKAGKPP